MTRPLGVAHLTLLALTPPQLVEVAAGAGFDFVGIRVKAVTETEAAFRMEVGSPMLAETLARLGDTGLTVRDIEFLPLTATTGPQDWLPALESGAALGATSLSVTGADPDRARLLDTLTALCRDAAEHGIRPTLEPISYQPVRTVADAAAVARATGAALLLDPLHLDRGGSALDDLRALEPDLVPVAQLCDAPAAAPTQTPTQAHTQALRPDGDGHAERIAAWQFEARRERLVVGEGALDLEGFVRALPAGTPISVEVPHERAQRTMSPRRWADRNARAARALLERVDAQPRTPGTTDDTSGTHTTDAGTIRRER